MTDKGKEYKSFPAYSKAVNDQGLVEHLVAIFGNVDDGGDIIHPGAFSKTILERGGKIRCLNNHQTGSLMDVVGKPVSMREIGRDELPPELLQRFPDATGGLMAKTQFLMSTPEGAGAFERIKAGAVDEYSIGYDALDADYSTAVKDGSEITVRNLRTIKLWEYSPVIFAMNPATTTLSAKASQPIEGKPWNAFQEGDKWVVYKIDADGKPTGEPLGTHDSEAEARAQVNALYANEPGKATSVTPEQKAGRVFAARNMARMKEIMKLMQELMAEMPMPDDDEDEEMPMMGTEHVTSGKQAAHKAGPVTPPTAAIDNADMLHLIEIELAEMQN